MTKRTVTTPTPTHSGHVPVTTTLSQRGREQPPSPAGRRNEDEGILNLIIEVSGRDKKEKAAKTATARNLWVPAINNHGGFGQWAFLEITDPWDVMNSVRAFVSGALLDGTGKLFKE